VIRKTLASTRGESLLEGIISILIFSILIAAVTMMIQLSLRITGTSFQQAHNRQEQANEAFSSPPTLLNIAWEFNYEIRDNTTPEDDPPLNNGVIPHHINIVESGNFVAFETSP